jgi:hypothetical protein
VVASPGRLFPQSVGALLDLLRSVKRSITFAGTMDEIEAFLDECRADPWFQSHAGLVDWLESVLTKFYLSGEGPEWQAIWDQVHAVLERTNDTPVDRCEALAVVLRSVIG